MSDQDLRWVQRLANYQRARSRMASAVELAQTRELSYLEELGLVQVFEFVFELAWNIMKDYFFYQGNPAITGPRDAIRSAFKLGLIDDGEGWMEMIKSRNQSAHTYNESVANEITGKILKSQGLGKSYALCLRAYRGYHAHRKSGPILDSHRRSCWGSRNG